MRLRELVTLTASLVVATLGAAGCTATVFAYQPLDARPSEADANGSADASSRDAPTPDAAPNEAAADAGADGAPVLGCPGTPPTKAALDLDPGWKPPPATNQTVCTPGDVTTFQNNFTTAQSFADLVANIPAPCASCILGPRTNATWSFLVTQGTDGIFNYGACYARAPNGSDACGKAIQYKELCIKRSCAGCSSSPERSACEGSLATQTACDAQFQPDINAGCGTNTVTLKALDDACGKATGAVKVLCGG